MGRSGSGKTTLARLIGGSLTALEGTITVMGRPVGHGDFPTDAAADGRPRLLVCTQEAHVFFGTLADNLRWSCRMQPSSRCARHWTLSVPAGGATCRQGMDTVVSGADSPLTRDQIQQLALARIVLADPARRDSGRVHHPAGARGRNRVPERRAGEPCGADHFARCAYRLAG